MFSIDKSLLLVIDIQGKLADLMTDKKQTYDNVEILIQGAKILNLPILVTEQYPKGLGHTIEPLAKLLTDITPIEKTSFSCCGDTKFMDALQSTNRNQIIICGIETHICVYQTSVELLKMGYELEIIADAVSSRTIDNKLIGLDKIKSAGGQISCTETILFELLKKAGSSEFKEISKLVK